MVKDECGATRRNNQIINKELKETDHTSLSSFIGPDHHRHFAFLSPFSLFSVPSRNSSVLILVSLFSSFQILFTPSHTVLSSIVLYGFLSPLSLFSVPFTQSSFSNLVFLNLYAFSLRSTLCFSSILFMFFFSLQSLLSSIHTVLLFYSCFFLFLPFLFLAPLNQPFLYSSFTCFLSSVSLFSVPFTQFSLLYPCFFLLFNFYFSFSLRSTLSFSSIGFLLATNLRFLLFFLAPLYAILSRSLRYSFSTLFFLYAIIYIAIIYIAIISIALISIAIIFIAIISLRYQFPKLFFLALL